MKSIFNYIIWLTIIALCAIIVVLFATSNGKFMVLVGCPAPAGERYGPLSQIDFRGFVHPFGRLNFDEPGTWKLVFRRNVSDDQKEVSSDDKFVMKSLQSIRFSCSGGDKGTVVDQFAITKDGKTVYHSAYSREGHNWGLQNSDFGFAPVASADEPLFRLMVDR